MASSKVREDWEDKIPEIEVWDAVDLSRMLDNNADVRASYEELIVPGDVLAGIYRQVQFQANRREHTFRGYLQYLVDYESQARADEAGDEDQLPLSRVFVDQTLRLDLERVPDAYRDMLASWWAEPLAEYRTSPIVPADQNAIPSSFALLLGAHDKVMLLAGPGYGKSTITQFLALYHASRLVRPDQARRLEERLKLPDAIIGHLDPFCQMRFPFRIELRRYAKWRKEASLDIERGVASYIARELIGKNVESKLSPEDIFDLANRNPILLILDGLDEVPNKDVRTEILKDFEAFLYRCSGEQADLQIVMSSRPQGYNGEFDKFEPLRWRINDLSESDFTGYCSAWLTQRIKGADDRAEAEERIKRGMQSEAVKRLATTLLQATVMLTIVRRKSDIPEERHKLFEKYVEVVFQREKAKNDLISKYELELRRLHEIVGYRLHEAVGRGDGGSIPEARFREYVREVWHLLRGDEPFVGIPNQECNNIVELATDRLVFLSGKGEDQTDIDFVIQPYREYFAAQYLNFHTEASPDKVFESLVERGPFWQNVLQFYVAVAAPAQQVAWVQRALEKGGHDCAVNELVTRVEYQRATLVSLPEYVRFSLPQLRRAIAVALPEETWWAWLGQEWAVPIIESLKLGEPRDYLLREFQRSGLNDGDNIAFALWIFPRTIRESAPERKVFSTLVKRLLLEPEHVHAAVTAGLLYRLDVDLKTVEDGVIAEVFEDHLFEPRLRATLKVEDLLCRLSEGAILRLLARSTSAHNRDVLGTDIWRFLGLRVETEPGADPLSEDDTDIAVAAPDWARIRASVERQLPLGTSLEAPHHPIRDYFLALVDALADPTSSEHDQVARNLEILLPDQPSWDLRSDQILGPPPSAFPSNEDWRTYRRKVREFFKSTSNVTELRAIARTLRVRSEKSDHLWSTLLFHPHDWDVLARFGLVADQTLKQLRTADWASLMRMPKIFLDLADYGPIYRYRPNLPPLPWTSLLRAGIALHNKHRLSDSSFLHVVSAGFDAPGVAADEVHALLKTVENPARFPDGWSNLLMAICVLTPAIDKKVVAEFWAKLSAEEERNIWLGPWASKSFEAVSHEWLSALMDFGDNASLHLAVKLAFQMHKIPTDLSPALNKRLVSVLSTPGSPHQKLFLTALLHTTSTIAEASLYRDVSWFTSAIAGNRRFLARAAERIQLMPQAISRDDYDELAMCLKFFTDRCNGYPVEVSAAALNALIQIDVASREPMNENLWRSDNQRDI